VPSPEQVALAHQRARAKLSRDLAREAKRLWRQVDPASIRGSWRPLAARLLIWLTGAQLVAAQSAEPYVGDVLAAQDANAVPAGQLIARSLAGVASDGRDLASLLVQPAIGALTAIGSGVSQDRAMATGYATLDMIVRTQVADAGRVADGVALASRPQATGYVRMVVGNTCSRCIVLAGRWYRWNTGFERHPNCDCVHVPAAENAAGDLRTDPKLAFASMTAAEQDQTFGKAGAQAIREGADIGRVVNARRGMQTAADGRLYTTEAAGKRPRLMPEQIYREAKDRDDAIRLLRLHGFIL
jgi:hypothetical protein